MAWVCGRSIGTPTVSSGADTMKMISSTSMTSTIGVTLISLITGLRRCRRLPTAPHARRRCPIRHPAIPYCTPRSSICRDRIAENSSAKPSRRWACLFTSETNLL